MTDAESESAILVALDFSESSMAALSIGSVLATQLTRRLILLHAFSYAPPHRYAVSVDWMVRELRERAKHQLGMAKLRLDRGGVSSEIVLTPGLEEPAVEILATAAKLKNPIMVLGTHARTSLDRFLIGSTAEKVLRRSNDPVITVGPQASPYWNRPIRNMLLATDLKERSLAPLPVLRSLWSNESHLLVLHVASPDAIVAGASWEAPIREKLERSLRAHALGARVEYKHVVCSSPSKAIHDTAIACNVDLVAIGAHLARASTSHGPTGTALEIVMSAPCAVLSVCA